MNGQNVKSFQNIELGCTDAVAVEQPRCTEKFQYEVMQSIATAEARLPALEQSIREIRTE
jgi:hypothetical protein